MSVINRMLKDLEKRQESGDSSVYHPVSEKSSGKLAVALGVLVAVLLAAVGGLLWYQHQMRNGLQTAAAGDGADSVARGAVAAETSVAPAPVQSPADEAIAAKELEDEKILDGAEKDAQLAALENEIYGPEDAMPLPASGAAEKRKGSSRPAQTAGSGAAGAKQGSMKVREVKLTRQQEIELDRKAVGVALSQGNLEEAKSALKSILSRDPANTEARERLAALLYGEHRLEEAKAVLNQGISGQPRYGKYRLLMARILAEEGRRREALTMLAAYSPSATRENLDYLSTEATLATELNESVIAIDAYGKLARIMPKEGKWRFGMAVAFDRQGTRSAALSNYRQAVKLGLPEASHNFAKKRISELRGNK